MSTTNGVDWLKRESLMKSADVPTLTMAKLEPTTVLLPNVAGSLVK